MSAQRLELEQETAIFRRTEAALNAWAFQCREISNRLGLPTASSGILKLASQLKAQRRKVRELRKARKLARRQTISTSLGAVRECVECGCIFRGASCPACAADPREAAIALGYAERPLTADGKQTVSNIIPELELGGLEARIDSIVRGLANWMRAAIFRSYLYGQPDRIAARELKITRAEFTSRRRAAVAVVAEKLAEHRAGAYSPHAY